VRVENHGADEARKKKKDVEKVKKEVGERAKLQCGERRQGSDEDLEDDDNDDNINDEEEDDIPWDELARNDEGSSTLPSASAQNPPGPMPAPTQQWEDARTEAMNVDRDTPLGAPCRWGSKR
jgi:hypothetical protein